MDVAIPYDVSFSDSPRHTVTHSRLFRAAIAAVAAMGVWIGLSGIAHASYFNWYMQGVKTGFSSRNWSYPTTGGQAIDSTSCSWNYGGGSGYTLQLTQNMPWYWPDRNAGTGGFPCPGGYGYHNYGVQAAGTYHFTVVGQGNPYGMNATGDVYYP